MMTKSRRTKYLALNRTMTRTEARLFDVNVVLVPKNPTPSSQFIVLEKIAPFLLIGGTVVSVFFWLQLVFLWNWVDPSPESGLVIVQAIASSLIAVIGWRLRTKEQSSPHTAVASTDTIIVSNLPSPLLNWDKRVKKARDIIDNFAWTHARNDAAINIGTDVMEVLTGSWPILSVVGHAASYQAKLPLYRRLSKEVASLFITPSGTIAPLDARTLSVVEEVADVIVTEVIFEFVARSLSQSWSYYIPFLRIGVSAFLAWAYTWTIGLVTVAYILNDYRYIQGDRELTIQICREILGLNSISIGPFRFLLPFVFQEPNWEDFFKYEHLSRPNSAAVIQTTLKLRESYSSLDKKEIKRLYFDKGIPSTLIETALEEKHWELSTPAPLPPPPTWSQAVKSELQQFKENLFDLLGNKK